ncbi:MAG: DUF1552 domain-containing protein [Myxococcaceae bacterium]|jgi:hypothetical protein|nr:DUF1552 domain-containing protein [Myxococcaceae bacterium]
MTNLPRRALLKALGHTALALPFFEALAARPARAQGALTAKRAIFFYFPDGVLAQSGRGEASRWHCTGSETAFAIPDQAEALRAWKSECLFFRNLSMGPTDSGSHPGGAKKLLTGVDGGNGESVDHYLSRTVGAQAPWRHLYLGAMATTNNAGGDKFIVYPTAGQTVAPRDDPRQVFQQLFATATPGGSPNPAVVDPRRSVIDGAKAELDALRARLGGREATKLSLHLEALREVERRIGPMGQPPPSTSCQSPVVDLTSVPSQGPYDASKFGHLLRAQIDVMVTAMACGLTRVGTLQASMHTSELIMSRMPGTEMYEPAFDMRSHQASHYGDAHDFARREVRAYFQQRRWFVEQFAYLLSELKKRPDGNGQTMLDTSVVLLCTEVCDGNTHLHDDMPFVLAGRAGGRLNPGRLLQPSWTRHGALLAAIAHAMGAPVQGWGQDNGGPLAGVLS